MHSSGKTLALTLLGLCALGLAASRPASAQALVYTLSGVTFDDGAVATGFFDFNPTTQTFGTYDITTTNGVTDTQVGATYTQSSTPNQAFNNDVFVIERGTRTQNLLVLDTTSPAAVPGIYSLRPGQLSIGGGFFDSGEETGLDVGRVVTTGSLVVTPAAAVPEASTTVSLGLLLMLGVGGAAVAARRKKAVH